MDYNTCMKCKLHKTSRNYVYGHKDLPVDIVLLDETPSETAEVSGAIRLTAGYRLIELLLAEVGKQCERKPMTFEMVPITFCRACEGVNEPTREPSSTEVLACTQNVLSRLNELKPKQVVFLTRTVARYYKREFPSAFNIVHPGIISRQGAIRSGWWMQTIRKFIEVSHKIQGVKSAKKKKVLG